MTTRSTLTAKGGGSRYYCSRVNANVKGLLSGNRDVGFGSIVTVPAGKSGHLIGALFHRTAKSRAPNRADAIPSTQDNSDLPQVDIIAIRFSDTNITFQCARSSALRNPRLIRKHQTPVVP
jgi:hypothetical protein